MIKSALLFLLFFLAPVEAGAYLERGHNQLGTASAGTSDLALEDIEGTQEWSLADARRALYGALTDSSPSSREEQSARTFRSLGQVMHLIQDMAQPQHTRNDPHLGFWIGPFIGAGGTSLYEAMTEDRLDASGMTSYAPVFGDADPTTFSRARSLWHTASGAGLADYSNREFVSIGTNFQALPNVQPLLEYSLLPAPGLPSPNGQEATIETRDIQALLPGSPLHGEVDFVVTPVEFVYFLRGSDGPWRLDSM